MKTVLLRLEGPLQSWGTRSRFDCRDTELEPSKSAVLGLVAAAMGLPREDDEAVAKLASLSMAVRIDWPGSLLRDYHTAGGGRFPGRPEKGRGSFGVAKASGAPPGTVVSIRDYLSDASFLVGLSGDDEEVSRIDGGLADPVWPLFLGRRSCPPSVPVRVGLRDGDAITAIEREPLPDRVEQPIRLVIECERALGEARRDVPRSFVTERRAFGVRYVASRWLEDGEEAAR